MRLIDADALMKNWERDRGRMFDADYFIFTIENAPTINAVPIILCKDCKHYDFTDNRIPQERVWWCYYWGCEIGANDFCSYAERKNNG